MLHKNLLIGVIQQLKPNVVMTSVRIGFEMNVDINTMSLTRRHSDCTRRLINLYIIIMFNVISQGN